MINSRVLKQSFLSIIILLTQLSSAKAMYAPTKLSHVPIQRLIENIRTQNDSAAIKEFRIGRLYAMAYALGSEQIPIREAMQFDSDVKPKPSSPTYTYTAIDWSPQHHPWDQWPESRQFEVSENSKTDAAKGYLEAAIEHYKLALGIIPPAPKNATSVAQRYPEGNLVHESTDGALKEQNARLGLAWCLDQAGRKSEAKALYRQIISMSARQGSQTASEAALYLLPLLDPLTDTNELVQTRLLASKRDYKAHYITPIVIPLQRHLAASQLMQPSKVSFDLGMGERTYSSWTSKNVGWLVYDDGSGNIQTGYQMFGNYSFFLFWKNGYEALSALDDNHDGVLNGSELRNLAVWCDEDCDGKSNSSEVKSLSDCGITGLSCDCAIDANGLLSSEHGVTFASGETRKSYDVVLTECSPRQSNLTGLRK